MKIHFEVKNNKRYAYTCTSRRIPGRKNPVSKKNYLGTVDEETGKIIPKNGGGRPHIGLDDGLDVRNYGDAAIVLRIAHLTHLAEDLEECFGNNYLDMLLIALAQALRPSPVDFINQTVNSSYLSELLGISDRPMSAEDVREIINNIEEKKCIEFFERRYGRCPGKRIAFGALTSQDEPGGSRTRFITPSGANSCVVILLGRGGVPLGFNIVKEPFQNTSGLRRMLSLIKECGIDFTFVPDMDMSPYLDVSELLMDGFDFMIPFSESSEQYRLLRRDYDDLMDPVYARTYGNRVYQMKEGRTGVLSARHDNNLVPSCDMGSRDCDRFLRTYMTFDPSVKARATDTMDIALESVKKRLDGTRVDDPDRALREVAGPLYPYLRCRKDPEGLARVSRNRKAVAEFRGNAGGILVLATSASWDDVMEARLCRLGVMSTRGCLFRNPGWPMEHVCRNTDPDKTMFIDFLVMIIYHEMLRIMEEKNEKTLTIAEALYIASSYKVVSDRGRAVMSSRDRRVGSILRMFGVDDGYVPANRTIADMLGEIDP